MKFKNKREFALAIIEHGKLYDKNGYSVEFDETQDNTFVVCKDSREPMKKTWRAYNEEWSTKPPLKDKDLVWCWEENYTHMRTLRFFDATNKCAFDEQGNRDNVHYKYYEKFKGEWPEWAREAVKTLED